MLTPRGRPREPSQIGALAIVAATAATALLVVLAGNGDGLKTEPASAAATWLGLVGESPKQVDLGQRAIVVLKAASLADKVTAAGGRVDEATERRWTRQALEAQKALLSRLALEGVPITPDFVYTRVINGFSAMLDPRAVALLERAPEVYAVYPVRAGYPTADSRMSREMRAAGLAARPRGLTLPHYNGRGVTVALLDTGVDRGHAYLGGHVLPGRDIVGGGGPALPQSDPNDPSAIERHGTEMAGVLVGRGGPDGIAGVAPGATVFPIRVAGWQPDGRKDGSWLVYARTDQVIAGLETAVDPNGDGDAHDAARIALLGVAEPYAGFTDGPEERAVDGALALDTLVVTPAGNGGPAGPAYGTIAGPGGARGALTVGAADPRRRTEAVRVAVRVGLDIRLAKQLPLAGAVAPGSPQNLVVAGPPPTPSPPLKAFFDADGRSIVAGRAALVQAGASPEVAVENAARAGAYAVLLYGNGLPAGGLGLDENVMVPVVALPDADGRTIQTALDAGSSVSVTVGVPRSTPNAVGGRIAGFSSRGLAFDSRVKPDLAAPGVTIPTAEPGTNEDGTARYGTVNGTSVAAAGVAGAAALLAQARPALGAADLMGVLVGTAHPLHGDPVQSQGAGLVDVGSADSSQLAVEPATLAFPPAGPQGGRTVQTLVVHNVSTRSLQVRLIGAVGGESLSLGFSRRRFSIAPGSRRVVKVAVRTAALLHVFEGAVVVSASTGVKVRVPWVVAPARERRSLIGNATLQPSTFNPSVPPYFASLTVNPGLILTQGGVHEIEPVARFTISLRAGNGKSFGQLAELRDLLPSQLSFGITGRAPTGKILGKGKYELILRAYPTAPGPVSRRVIRFRIQK